MARPRAMQNRGANAAPLLLVAAGRRKLRAIDAQGISAGKRYAAPRAKGDCCVSASGAFYDALETRDPARREAELMLRLPRVVATAKQRAPFYRRLLAEVRPQDVIDRRTLAGLPLTRKSELIETQRAAPPLGGLLAVSLGELA
jgi:hypothetical protein